eukprot:TRINITY_DN1964_c0_g1_i2.p1 TRINITY_DN1964_c0_g1~~TRINITY_DN1964_c0_g1_i2.p1  ORF type:complete len:109 (-),score=9.06 TRINITY_DN1964_c0_g1_i2:161-487(-)
MSRTDAFSHVFGGERPSHVRGYGLGPRPTSLFGSTSSYGRSSSEVRKELEQMKAHMTEKKTQMIEKAAIMEAKMAETNARMVEVMRMMYALQQATGINIPSTNEQKWS